MIKRLVNFFILVGTAQLVFTATMSAQGRLVRTQAISLKKCYSTYFPTGTDVDAKRDIDTPVWAAFISKQYAGVKAQNEMKSNASHPSEKNFEWYADDNIVMFGMQNGLKVQGHCLVFYSHMPKWMLVNNGVIVSKDLFLNRLPNHINTAVGRYKGKVYCWDVVNEAVSGIAVENTSQAASLG